MVSRISTKKAVKRLVNANRWAELGRLFGFTPVYHFTPARWIDWRCVPQSLMDVLQAGKKVHNLPPSTSLPSGRPRKKDEQSRWQEWVTHRELLFKTQGGICHYCKNLTALTDWSVDHRLPYYRGGRNNFNNKVGCCKPCNHLKACLTEEEFVELLKPGRFGLRERCKHKVKEVVKLRQSMGNEEFFNLSRNGG